MMRRREVITLLGGAAAAWPLVARAQQGERVRRVAVLMGYTESDPVGQSLLTTFVQALQKLGWTSGRNVQIDLRWPGGDPEKYQPLASALVDLHPDVILAVNNLSVTALRRAVKNIPIVFTQVSDPLGRGFVATLARPGGNVTGFGQFEASMGGKWLQMLKEIAPKLTRVALLFDSISSPHIVAGFYVRAAEEAGRRAAVQTFVTPVHDPSEAERTIGKFAAEPNSGLVVLPDSFTILHADLIIGLAARFGLAAIYPFRLFAARGGLLYYGVNPKEQFSGAASYVDRILKGAMPAELPVQFPSKFELIVNLKAAKALGLTVPDTLLARADEVIE